MYLNRDLQKLIKQNKKKKKEKNKEKSQQTMYYSASIAKATMMTFSERRPPSQDRIQVLPIELDELTKTISTILLLLL